MTVVGRNPEIKTEKNGSYFGTLLCETGDSGHCDYIGDSFYLSKVVVGLKEQTIVFCGVSSWGESAKVLNLEKTVLML